VPLWTDMSTETTYHNLKSRQIKTLIKQGCTADDWSNVTVAQPLNTDRIRNAHFTGKVRIGVLDGKVSLSGGLQKQTGIYNAAIHNCNIADNVYINNVENYIADYDIASDVVIEHVSLLATDGSTSFGNGTEVAVISEMGARQIPIYDHLSSQVAYILALYRHRPAVIDRLRAMIDSYTQSVTASRGAIGRRARLINCGTLRNIRVGPSAVLDGASHLENGSINSCPEDPCCVGTNVIARDFILSAGAVVTDGTILRHCFVGQATELARQYSAENSVFFANCGGYHGEACSIFAGPYTVTFHKSTLLIAGLYSFLNAGSGSNQSNHMYKLGPVHQGIVERGSKTTSDSYILWPARVGAFTLVMGRHYANSDTSSLPFSYLIEHEDQSLLVPGVNLRNIGTVRDSRKWPKRDKRKSPRLLDKIIFNLLSPYTAHKMAEGIAVLSQVRRSSGPTSQDFSYNGVRIKKSSLEQGLAYYRLGLSRYLGNILVSRLRENDFSCRSDLAGILAPQSPVGTGRWLDIAGLIAPQQAIDELLDSVENGSIDSLESVDSRFDSIYRSFSQYEWTWVADEIGRNLRKDISQATPAEIAGIIRDWITAVEKLDNMRLDDAAKEYAPASRVSFGVDGTEDTRDEDFRAVRGTSEQEELSGEIRQRLEQKKQTAGMLLEKLDSLS